MDDVCQVNVVDKRANFVNGLSRIISEENRGSKGW